MVCILLRVPHRVPHMGPMGGTPGFTTTRSRQSYMLKNPGGTLNVEVIGILVGNFLENPKKYPDFDFKLLKIPKSQF